MTGFIVTAMPASLARPWLPAFGDAAAFSPEIPRTDGDASPAGDTPRVVCFYCAPWDMPECVGNDGPEDFDAWLSAWMDYHAGILGAWRASPDGVLLVNARRAGEAPDIARRLAAAGLALDAACAPTDDSPALPAWVRGLLAGHLAESAPEVWECYEALESCALLTGPMPEFRGSAGLVDMADTAAVFRAAARLADGPVEAGVDPALLEDARARAHQLEAQLDLLRNENELLALQVGQLHQEIELADDARREMQARIPATGEPASAPSGAHRELALERERDALRQENEMLALQIGQLHAELESATGEARLAGQLAERASGLAERARKLLVRLHRTAG